MGAGGATGRVSWAWAGSPAGNRFPVMVGPQPSPASLSMRPALRSLSSGSTLSPVLRSVCCQHFSLPHCTVASLMARGPSP